MKKQQPERKDRYSRQEAFYGVGRQGQEKLAKGRVAIVGMGALGTVTANNLVRAGVGFVRMVDRDYVELNNLQRQMIFREQDAKEATPKAIAAAEILSQVNSEVTMEPVVADLNSGNVDQYLSDVDLVLDASDNMEVRHLINEACQVLGKPWIYGGVLGATGMTMNFLGGENPCLYCLTGDVEPGGETCVTAGVLNTATSIIASLQSTEAIKILIGSDSVRRGLLTMDLWSNEFELLDVERQADCPVCGRGEYQYYGKAMATQTTSLCGRDSIQVVPAPGQAVDFQDFAERLTAYGSVQVGKFTLDFDNGTIGIKLFPDGRAIIKNVTDEGKAKSIYAEYIGL